MKVYKIFIFFLILVLLLLSGCTLNKNNQKPISNPPETISWYIFTDSMSGNLHLSEYSAVNEVFASHGMELDLQFIESADANEVLGKMLTSKKLADIITVERHSLNSYKLLRSGKVYDIKELSETLYSSIPDDIKKEYADENGQLLCIPGGYNNQQSIATEGMYVRAEFYDILGSPDMSSTAGFYDAIRRFSEFYEKTYSSKPVPVLFGKDLKGLSTFEHIFGVMPIDKGQGIFYHKMFSDNMKNALGFLSQLGKYSRGISLRTVDDHTFDTVMKNNVFVCFSPESDIDRYNRQNPDKPFIFVPAPLAKNGFYESYKTEGNFETFVSQDTKQPKAVAEILSVLSSKEKSILFMYGEEDIGWVYDGEDIKILSSYKQQVRNDNNNYTLSPMWTFPYLSNVGYCNPYLYDAMPYARDITNMQYYVTPTDFCAAYVKESDAICVSLYNDCLSQTITITEALKRLNEFTEAGPTVIYGN